MENKQFGPLNKQQHTNYVKLVKKIKNFTAKQDKLCSNCLQELINNRMKNCCKNRRCGMLLLQCRSQLSVLDQFFLIDILWYNFPNVLYCTGCYCSSIICYYSINFIFNDLFLVFFNVRYLYMNIIYNNKTIWNCR